MSPSLVERGTRRGRRARGGRLKPMRVGLSIALALAMSIPPRPVLAGGLSREQLATLDRLIALENLHRGLDAGGDACPACAGGSGGNGVWDSRRDSRVVSL